MASPPSNADATGSSTEKIARLGDGDSAATIAAEVERTAGTTTNIRFAHQRRRSSSRYASERKVARDLISSSHLPVSSILVSSINIVSRLSHTIVCKRPARANVVPFRELKPGLVIPWQIQLYAARREMTEANYSQTEGSNRYGGV